MGHAADPFAGAGAAAESTFHIADYLQILQRHWRLIVLATVLAAGVGGVRYAMTPREYRAETQIQIERRSLSTLATTSQSSNPWLESWWNLEYYPTQYRLLQSRGLAERVVKNLRLYEQPGFGGTAAANDEAALGALAGQLLGGLEVTPIPNTQLVVIAYRSRDPKLAAAVANGFADAFIDWGIETRTETVGAATDFLSTQISEIKRQLFAKEAELQRASGGTAVVGGEPAANVAQERMAALNQSYVTAKDDRISKEARYSELLRTNKDSIAASLASPALSQMRSELAALEREYESDLKTYRPETQRMVERRAKIERQRESVQRAVDELVTAERDRARADYQEAQRREQQLANEMSALRAQNVEESSTNVAVATLSTEIADLRQTLSELQQRQTEASMTSRLKDTRESNVRVVDRALVPGGPFRPSLRREVSVGLMFGLMLGLGLVVLIEFMDRTLKEPEDVEKLLGLPTLAVIPDAAETGRGGRRGYGYGYGYGYGSSRRKSAQARPRDAGTGEETGSIELLPHLRPRLAIAETYRSLRTGLQLASAHELKVISLTSAESGEGKTTTAANLAVVFAQLGRQVLLIDGDLRRPRLHEIMKVSNRVGLVNLLTGGANRADEVFVRTPVPNLYLLPSGTIPPNPAELLASDRMRDFIQHVRSHFDIVLIDSPPTLAVTDAVLIGSLADGVLLCLRAGRVNREDARACRDRLVRAELKILGTVLNGYRATQGRYGRRYYRYSPDSREIPVAALRDSKDSAA
ncbi:MAG TPA: polysaccharide biosynthesis tyrosine autokinase [Thermoanaerobaculia bacterium]|nr:polysaccharide biosynthesis tyrosine autokinase [Thermoanaerobaculia bacterium]